MVDAVVVANESIGDAAQFQQAIPVGVVACQTRDFQTEDDTDVSQGNFAGEASEPGTFVGTGSGEPEVFIDGDHLLLSPAQLTGLVSQGVLPGGGFAVMLDLAWRGLANVNIGRTLGVRRLDFGGISHWSAPGAGLGWLGQEGAPESRRRSVFARRRTAPTGTSPEWGCRYSSDSVAPWLSWSAPDVTGTSAERRRKASTRLRRRSTSRSEERRVGKECRSRWSPYH